MAHLCSHTHMLFYFLLLGSWEPWDSCSARTRSNFQDREKDLEGLRSITFRKSRCAPCETTPAAPNPPKLVEKGIIKITAKASIRKHPRKGVESCLDARGVCVEPRGDAPWQTVSMWAAIGGCMCSLWLRRYMGELSGLQNPKPFSGRGESPH